MPPCDFWIDLFFLPVEKCNKILSHIHARKKKNLRDETASYVIHCDKHDMTWMPTKELTQVHVALQGNLQQTNIPKAGWFLQRWASFAKKHGKIPSLLEIQFYLKWTCQSNWNIRSLRISYWKNNTFLDISIHFNPEMSEAPTCTLGNPDTCGLGWLRTMKPHGKNASFYRGKLTDIWRPQKMGWQCGFLQCINNRTTPYTSPFLSSLCFLSSYISYILIPTLLADGVCRYPFY